METQTEKKPKRQPTLKRYDQALDSLRTNLSHEFFIPVESKEFGTHHGITTAILKHLTDGGYLLRQRHKGQGRLYEYKKTDSFRQLTPEIANKLVTDYNAKHSPQAEETPAPVQPEAVQLPLPLGDGKQYALLYSDNGYAVLPKDQTKQQAVETAESAAKELKGDCFVVQLVAKVEYKPTTTFF